MWRKTALYILLLCSNKWACAQQGAISDEVNALFEQQCNICAQHPGNAIGILQASDTAALDLNYHNCHVFLHTSQIDAAYRCCLQVLDQLKTPRSDPRRIMASYAKAKILFTKHIYGPALAAYEQTIDLIGASRFSDELLNNICANAGEICLELQHYPQALNYLVRCLGNTPGDQLARRSILYSNIALCYLHTDQPRLAEAYFGKALAATSALKDTAGLAALYINMANEYYNNHQDALAVPYFKKGLGFAERTADNSLKQLAYINMAVVSEDQQDYKAALNYRKLYEEQRDSVYNRDAVWKTASLKNELDSQKNAHKIQSVQQANKLQALKLAEQRRQLHWSLLFAFIFLSFFVFAFYAYRQKIRQNRIITAQREELDALNHTKDQLFSVVAHDLRSPVQTLKTRLIRHRAALADDDVRLAETMAAEIETISNRTYSLLNNLLYWAMSQTGQLHFDQDKLDTKRLVDHVLYDYTPVAAAKNIQLENRVAEGLYCSGDMNTVKIILRNLVDNAIKFSDPATSVFIDGTGQGRECLISVTDCGPGMDAAIIQALADGHSGRVQKAQSPVPGTGLGLWLVKTMVERNGGSLHIERKAKGTRIDIHLAQYPHQ